MTVLIRRALRGSTVLVALLAAAAGMGRAAEPAARDTREGANLKATQQAWAETVTFLKTNLK